MSKYNLTDILEQYKIGSGWTNDFDYEGMLNAGLKATLEDRIESLEALAEDFTDVNYHREASHLYDALEALEKGDAFEAEGKISDFHAEIKKTMESFDMDMSDDLGAYMASKMDLDEDKASVDLAIEASQEKAGIEVDESFKSLAKKLDKQKGIDKDEAAKIAGSIAAKKAAGAGKGPTAKQKKRMSEGILKDVVLAIIKDTNATNPEVQMYIDSLTNDIKLNGKEAYANYEIDDYIEDFKNYVADKSLQEKQYAPEVVDRIEMVRKVLYDTNDFDYKEIEAYTRSMVSDFEKGDFIGRNCTSVYVEDIKNKSCKVCKNLLHWASNRK